MTVLANRLSRLWPVLLFAAVATLMVRDWLSDPFDPARIGTASYGHNSDGVLARMLGWTACELVVLMAVLAPGRRTEVSRAVAALLLAGPWFLFFASLVMHAGGVVIVHALWLMALNVGVLVTLFSRMLSRLRNT